MAANHGLFALRLAVWLGLSKIAVCQEQVVHAQVCNVQFILILGISVSPSTYHFGVPLLCPQTRFPGSRPLAAKFWCTMLSLKRSAKEEKKSTRFYPRKVFLWLGYPFKKSCLKKLLLVLESSLWVRFCVYTSYIPNIVWPQKSQAGKLILVR